MRASTELRHSCAPRAALLAAGRKEIEMLVRTPAVSLGIYRCGHKHRGLGAEEATLACTVNFPRHGVYVKHVRGRELLVAPGRAVFFNRGEPFSTSHPHGCGDGGRWIAVRSDVLLAMLAHIDPAALERPELPYRATDVGIDAEVELAQAALFARSHELDPLTLEELTLALVARVLRAVHSVRAVDAVRREHRDLAAAAQHALVRRFGDSMTLEALAKELGVSMFHLCRVFRVCAGETLHAYRERVRLSAALDSIADGTAPFTQIALACGYSSHSHFTLAFRRRFGVTPSKFRATASRTTLTELNASLQFRR